MVQRLALVRKARGAVGHDAFALRGANGHAQVGFARLAKQTFAALGGVERNDVVARLNAGDPFAHLDHNARALMAQHDRKQPFGVFARERESVRVADAGVRDLDQHLTLARWRDVDLDNLQRLASFKGDGCTRFHKDSWVVN